MPFRWTPSHALAGSFQSSRQGQSTTAMCVLPQGPGQCQGTQQTLGHGSFSALGCGAHRCELGSGCPWISGASGSAWTRKSGPALFADYGQVPVLLTQRPPSFLDKDPRLTKALEKAHVGVVIADHSASSSSPASSQPSPAPAHLESSLLPCRCQMVRCSGSTP